MKIMTLLVGILIGMSVIVMILYVAFGQITVCKLRRNPKTKHGNIGDFRIADGDPFNGIAVPVAELFAHLDADGFLVCVCAKNCRKKSAEQKRFKVIHINACQVYRYYCCWLPVKAATGWLARYDAHRPQSMHRLHPAPVSFSRY